MGTGGWEGECSTLQPAFGREVHMDANRWRQGVRLLEAHVGPSGGDGGVYGRGGGHAGRGGREEEQRAGFISCTTSLVSGCSLAGSR